MGNRRDFIKKSFSLGSALAASPLLAAQCLGKNDKKGSGILKAKALKAGDTIGIVAPAGAVFEEGKMRSVSEALSKFGFNTKFSPSLLAKNGYLAGKDQDRADALHDMFKDPLIDGIIAMRGGYGCNRILDLLDYTLIKQNPKVLVGFSDITALLLAITAKTGLVTFHGPMGYSSWNDYTCDAFFKACMQSDAFALSNAQDEFPFYTIREGKAKGSLLGGNLIVFSTLIGSEYMPDLNGKVLFLEEISEEVYRIDRLLSHLKLSGSLEKLEAVFFGVCKRCEAEHPSKSLELKEVLEYYFKPLGIPAWYGSSIGHIANKLTIPIGLPAEVDAKDGRILFSEGAVI